MAGINGLEKAQRQRQPADYKNQQQRKNNWDRIVFIVICSFRHL
jgi:hypothetical protein